MKLVHPNFIKASNFIFITAGLQIVNIILTPKSYSTTRNIIINGIGLIATVGLGFLIRKGVNWAGFVFVLITILGLIIYVSSFNKILLDFYKQHPVNAVNSGLALLLQVWTIILLFTASKPTTANSA
jgi:hypothetical protein